MKYRWMLGCAGLSVGMAQVAAATAPDQGPIAQQAAQPPVGEIVVTAQKRSEKLNDVPLSVVAASGQTLTKLGISGPADLGKIVPGFSYAKSAYGAPVFFIRGVGVYDDAVGVAPTVGVYVDQVPLAYSRMTLGSTLDVERVEVLKGPQGTLYGNNATGGAINYIANKPTNHFAMGFDASYGRFNEANFTGFVSGPIAENLKGRIALGYERRGDWQESVTSDRTLGQRNFLDGRLLLDWQPSDRLKFEFGATG